MTILESAMRRGLSPQASLFFWAVLVGIDQWSKLVALEHHPTSVLCNPGASWGVSLPVSVLVIFSIGILVAMIGIQWNRGYSSYPLLFLLSGGTGNLIDRLIRECVVDFFSFASFPMFNMADVYLTVGCCLFVGGYLFRRECGDGRGKDG